VADDNAPQPLDYATPTPRPKRKVKRDENEMATVPGVILFVIIVALLVIRIIWRMPWE
jgi:hypothetical protein